MAMSLRIAKVRVLAGFIMPGRAPAQEGEVLELPESFVRELLHSNKVERVPDEPAPAEPPSDPATQPASADAPPPPASAAEKPRSGRGKS